MKIIETKHNSRFYNFEFYCPGCKCIHGFRTADLEKPSGLSPELEKLFDENKWTWNNDPYNPTISPSINIKTKRADGSDAFSCHFFVENGKIKFLSDCSHSLAGRTVDLPNYYEMDNL